MRPVLVGESNPYGKDPAYALYPEPATSAGGRLCREILGLTPSRYISLFHRRNLLVGDRWSASAAAEAAMDLCVEFMDAPLILLGSRVCRAFGVAYEPFAVVISDPWALCLPHPSGRCRAWNDPVSYQRARDALSALYPGYAAFAGSNRRRKVEALP